MSVRRKVFTFSGDMVFIVVSALSIFIFGAILFWTLDHTDIVAFVTVLLAATSLEAFLIFFLLKSMSISGNNFGDQRAGSGMLAKLPKLVRKS
jgi:hypothetical protein